MFYCMNFISICIDNYYISAHYSVLAFILLKQHPWPSQSSKCFFMKPYDDLRMKLHANSGLLGNILMLCSNL